MSRRNRPALRKAVAGLLNPMGAIASRMRGDARSYFYGDPKVDIDPEDAASALVGQDDPEVPAEQAVVDKLSSSEDATQKLEAYRNLDPSAKSKTTLLPALAVWNAQIKLNPVLGKILAASLDYNLTKALNDYPFAGTVLAGSWTETEAPVGVSTVTVNQAALFGVGSNYEASIPFVIITIAASTLTAQVGKPYNLYFEGVDEHGATVQVNEITGGFFSFYRTSNVEAISAIFIPYRVVATRSLPFLPVITATKSFVLKIGNILETESVSITIPGYSTKELNQVAKMYALPSGDIH